MHPPHQLTQLVCQAIARYLPPDRRIDEFLLRSDAFFPPRVCQTRLGRRCTVPCNQKLVQSFVIRQLKKSGIFHGLRVFSLPGGLQQHRHIGGLPLASHTTRDGHFVKLRTALVSNASVCQHELRVKLVGGFQLQQTTHIHIFDQ